MPSIFDAAAKQKSALGSLLAPKPTSPLTPAAQPASVVQTQATSPFAGINLNSAVIAPSAPAPTATLTGAPSEADWASIGFAPPESEGPDAYGDWLFKKLSVSINSVTQSRETLVELHGHLKAHHPGLLAAERLGAITAAFKTVTAGAHRVASATKSEATAVKATKENATTAAVNDIDDLNFFG